MRPSVYIFFTVLVGVFAFYCPSTSESQIFPLAKVSRSTSGVPGHLRQADGKPFLIKNMASWGLIGQLSEADAQIYMDTIKAKGFNSMLVMLICKHKLIGDGTALWNGISPFRNLNDFSTYNTSYFDHAERIIAMAQSKGMLIFLLPAYAGAVNDPKQGWWSHISSSLNSNAKLEQYGRFLGSRFAKYNNIIWTACGDHYCDQAPGEAGMKALIEAIIDTAPSHLWTAHIKTKWSSRSADYRDYLDLDAFYSTREATLPADERPQHASVLKLYKTSPYKFVFQLDQGYEKDEWGYPETFDYQMIRRKNYNGLLSGAAGTSFGAGIGREKGQQVWHLQPTSAWKSWLGVNNGPGTKGLQEAKHMFAVFSSVKWNTLIPDVDNRLVVAGRGTVNDPNFVGAAKSLDGTLAMAYIPSAKPITIDLSQMAAPQVRARWYNPVSGTYALVGEFPSGPGQSRVVFRPTLTHPDGSDWLLLLENSP